MDIWTGPLIGVILIVCLISYLAIRKTSKMASLVGERNEVSDSVADHPFVLNPILWVILTVTVFIGIVIFYYATSF